MRPVFVGYRSTCARQLDVARRSVKVRGPAGTPRAAQIRRSVVGRRESREVRVDLPAQGLASTGTASAHPAIQFADVAELEDVTERLNRLGFDIGWSQRHNFPGNERCHTVDGQENRDELLAPLGID